MNLTKRIVQGHERLFYPGYSCHLPRINLQKKPCNVRRNEGVMSWKWNLFIAFAFSDQITMFNYDYDYYLSPLMVD